MKYLVENEVIPKVVREYKRPYIIHKTILTYGQAKVWFQDWSGASLPEFLKLSGICCESWKVRLRISARGINKELAEIVLKNT
jgi:nicotinamide-nucleotide amidase